MLRFKEFIVEMPVRYSHITPDYFDHTRPYPQNQLKRSPWGKKIPIKDAAVRRHGYEMIHYHNEDHPYTDQYVLLHKPTNTVHFRVNGFREEGENGPEFKEGLTQRHPSIRPPIHMGHVYSAILSHNHKLLLDTSISTGMEKTLKKNVINHPGLDVQAHFRGESLGPVTHHNFDDFMFNKNSREPGNEEDIGYETQFHVTRKAKR